MIKMTNVIVGQSLDHRKSDAIVILGCRGYFWGKPHPRLVARVKKGVELAQRKVSDLIIFSGGGKMKYGKNESDVMQEIFNTIDNGVSKARVLLEEKSRSTYENLLNLRAITKRESDTVTIVTDPFHVCRTYLIAKKLGIHALVVVSSDAYPWLRRNYFSRFWLREMVSLVQYTLLGRI